MCLALRQICFKKFESYRDNSRIFLSKNDVKMGAKCMSYFVTETNPIMIAFQESHRQKLIVSADDFGISPRANRNILYLISLGKINRVGIMINGEISSKEASELIHSGVKLDIHLDILHKFDNNRKKRFGAFLRVIEFLGKILTGKVSTKKVRVDWQQQVEKFQTIFGKYPDGINSHEHVHFFPPFFKVALKLQEKYTIPYIRFGDSIKMRHHTIIAYILHLLRIINKRACGEDGCVSSNYLVSLDWIKNIDAFINILPDGKTEIVCHPELAEEFVKIKEYF
ncbi:MAG: YdjC-like protein [Parcubacteria group bacterium GW2011_GWC1_36_108]|nr:MAG: YdjC-like protein [Parcubacteria group bacterium GW2011_GWC1_36_108]